VIMLTQDVYHIRTKNRKNDWWKRGCFFYFKYL